MRPAWVLCVSSSVTRLLSHVGLDMDFSPSLGLRVMLTRTTAWWSRHPESYQPRGGSSQMVVGNNEHPAQPERLCLLKEGTYGGDQRHD